MDKSFIILHLSVVRDILEGRAAGEDTPAVSVLGSILNRQKVKQKSYISVF